MQKSRACQSATNSQKRCESSRKRPLIVFDGSSTSTSIKLKKADDGSGPVDRLKPPPSGNLTNTIRRLSGSSTNSSSDGSNRSAVDLVSGATEKQCSEAPIHRSPSGNGMSPPPTSPPGGTAVVKLKRQAPKEGESEDAVSEVNIPTFSICNFLVLR
ncbi:ASHWN protein, partial [Amia calva]|nr:ASHWN protein [Amia calva]